jgi:molecular chaperone GrpE
MDKEEINDKVKEEKNQKADEIIELKKQIESQKVQIDETEDRLKRVAAEFDNYKKRNTKERDGMYNSLVADIISNFLPVIDNLEKAVATETKDEEYKKGIELVLKQFKDVLTARGIVEIEAVGNTFDPELHEAVSSVQDETKGEKEIVQEYRKGYKIGDRVIRHSMVVVAN